MTLTSDLVSRISIKSGAFLGVDASWDGQVSHTILGHCDLDL